MIDEQGRVTEINDAFERMIGIPRDEAIGSSALFPWWAPEEREPIIANLLAQLATGRAHHEFQFTRADGTSFPVALDLTRIGEGPGSSVMAVVRDLSSEAAERRRRRDAERIAGLSTWEIDPPTGLLTGSTGLLSAAGIHSGETFSIEQFLEFVPEPDAQQIRDALESLEHDKDEFKVEHRIAGTNEDIRWMEVHGHAVRDEAGQLLRIHGATQDVTDRHLTADALRGSQELLHMAERVAEIGSFETDDRTGQMTWSDNMHRLFKRTAAEFRHGHVEGVQMIHEEDRDRFLSLRRRVRENGASETIQHRYYRDDEVRWSETRLEPLREGGEIIGVRGTLQDITSRRRDEDEIRLQAHLLDVVDASVIATDLEGVITHWNSRAEQLYGWSGESAIGRPLLDLGIDAAEEAIASEVAKTIAETGTWRGEYDVRHQDGTVFPALVQTSLYHDELGIPAGVLGTSMDLTERVDMEGRLRAGRDYMRAVTDSIGEGMYTLDEEGRMLYMNPAAEAMLGWKLGELEGKVVHHAIHYRHRDGSDFPIEECPIGNTRTRRETVRVDEDIYIAKDGSELPVEYTASPIETDEGVLGAVVVFSDITERLQNQREVERRIDSLSWIGRIHDALENDLFVVYAQPIVDLEDGAVLQHELLIRMLDADGSLIPPGKFLPVAEEFGVIGEIDRWMTGQAADLAAAGHRVHLNLSAQSIGSARAIKDLCDELERSGADPENLIVELTETALIDNEQEAEQFADKLRSIGCLLALDDFGTGYGGFSYLKRLPADYLKIDREFVSDLTDNDASRHVVTAVVNLARGFGQKTVAEGVEDAATMEILSELGVDYAQGFHIARPGPVNEVLERESVR